MSGITLGAWAIHPNQNMSFINGLDGNCDLHFDEQRKENFADRNRSLYEIESGTGVKYLSSILDFDVGDIPMLEKLREDVFENLFSVYGVDRDVDKVKLFFHFPVAEKTATLHLHVWVNKADHPLNNARSFGLDEIIDCLKGNGVIDMILSRNGGRYFIPVTDTIGSIAGIPNFGAVSNPFIFDL
ncbi:hypothetical protein IMF27_16540 [Pseudomonas sp. PCH199]|uniref:hypothetical protein n=1 Tax=unclassified Pseudomonas TaxID=196821 RepID=UPI000BD5D0A7|nr:MULTISPECIES: hypothetical protein [unclassified Pseudomonas]MCW8277095.1 hypothetical protein [Pseudomonas sp. PCH199]PAM82592.1 hypothetical protein CES87_16880 [Pseudomonas sp. ERMR1:02]